MNKVKASVDLRIPSYLSVCLKWDKNLKDPGIITEVLETIKERLVSHAEKETQPHKYFSVKASWSLIWLEYYSLLTFCRSPMYTCTTRCVCTDMLVKEQVKCKGSWSSQCHTLSNRISLLPFFSYVYMKYIHI